MKTKTTKAEPFRMPLPELEEGVGLAPHEMPLHAELAFANLPRTHNAHSIWRQRGTKLVCTTCPDEHAVFVPPQLIFTGEVDSQGAPQLKNRW